MGAGPAPSKTKARLIVLSQVPNARGYFFLSQYMKPRFILKYKTQEYIAYVFLCSRGLTSQREGSLEISGSPRENEIKITMLNHYLVICTMTLAKDWYYDEGSIVQGEPNTPSSWRGD